MSNLMDHNNIKRLKKPKPLFGIFRKNKPDPVVVPSTSTPLIRDYKNDPYSPPTRIPKTIISEPRRPRSKSVGNSYNSRLMEERESALNKLCQKEINSPTLVESLPLLSPTYNTPPPVPPIPLRHQQSNLSPRSPIQQQSQKPTMRKFSSAHDLRKAAKLQQDSIAQAQIKPLPQRKKDLSRSKSLNGSRPQQQQQFIHMPITPNVMNLSKPRWPPIKSDRDDDDDDDIPLGYLQSPKSSSSLLSDNEEEDDKDLIPIATLNIVQKIDSTMDYQTAADKYKEKVKERLQLDDDDDDDDDNIPLVSLCK